MKLIKNHLMLSRMILIFLFSLASINNALAQLSPEQRENKSKGIVLYNQYKANSAIPFLLVAAEAGDHEAQYYLGEALRQKTHYMNAEARAWYEKSANQGDLYAMIQLGRSNKDVCKYLDECGTPEKQPIEWLNQAKEIAEKTANDAESMYILYELTADENRLMKAATAGYAEAQYWVAIGYKQGEGFFLPWTRTEEVEKWFKLSAEGGYPKSMMEYGALLYEKGDIQGFRKWNERAALAGYPDSVYGYGAYLSHEPDTFGFPYDPVKGYGLMLLLSELDGGGGMKENAEYKLPIIAAKMTSEQILQAHEFAKTWKATHPPLSFFPDKLSR